MAEVPVGAVVGEVRFLQPEEAIEIIQSGSYLDASPVQFPDDVRELGKEMMVAFVQSYNLICGMDEIGQLLLYWHGDPATLIQEYYLKKLNRST